MPFPPCISGLGGTTPGTPVSVGTANAEGGAATIARSDHVHDTEAGFIDSADKFTDGVVSASKLGAGPLLEVRMLTSTSASGNGAPVFSTYSPPATARLRRMVVNITQAYDGASPKMRLGTLTTSEKYLVNSPILSEIRTYVYDGLDILMSPTELIRTSMSRVGGTATGAGTISMFFSIPEV